MSAELLALARAAAHAAGALLLERFGDPASGVAAKSSRTDLVSDADRDAEALVLGMIAAERPGDAVLAEEGGGGAGRTGHHLAGRSPRRHDQLPVGRPPVERQHRRPRRAGRAGGRRPRPLPGRDLQRRARRGRAPGRERRSPCGAAPRWRRRWSRTGFSYRAAERARQADRLLRVLPAVRDVRRFGSAALDLAWVAAGRIDGYFETGLNPWDRAAGRAAGERGRGRGPRAARARAWWPPSPA